MSEIALEIDAKSISESLPNVLSEVVGTYFRLGAVRARWRGPVLVTWGSEKARYLRVHCDMA